jgi:hypothetical protein
VRTEQSEFGCVIIILFIEINLSIKTVFRY